MDEHIISPETSGNPPKVKYRKPTEEGKRIRLRAKEKRYLARHPEKRREKRQRYLDAHRERMRAHKQDYRTRTRAEDSASGYYVYLLKHPVTLIVFYVGCSKNRWRLSDHLRMARHANCNKDGQFLKNATVRYLLLALGENPIFKKVVEGLPKKEAHELESLMIQKIGTLELGSGPLVNGSRKRKSIDVCFELIEKEAEA